MRKFKISAKRHALNYDVLSLSSTDGGTTWKGAICGASVKWPNGAEPPLSYTLDAERYELLLTLRQGTGANKITWPLGDPTTALSITPITDPVPGTSGADGVVEIDPNIADDFIIRKLPLSEIGGGGADANPIQNLSYNGDKSSAVALISVDEKEYLRRRCIMATVVKKKRLHELDSCGKSG
ncbi:hypothetical protein SPFM10_00162 [Salmonella phage SPFM10]|nr:hypothetical protein SPFM10_00162 [Salmonella phage SPFM10]